MTVQMNCVKESFITSGKVNSQSTIELCQVIVFY